MGLEEFRDEGSNRIIKKVILSEDMKTPTEELGYIIGVILSDGGVHEDNEGSKYIILNATDKDFVVNFGKVFCSWAGLEWSGFDDENTQMSCRGPIEQKGNAKNQWRVERGIADCYNFLNVYQKGEYKTDKLLNNPRDFKIGLLRGLWDGEGSVSTNYKQIGFTTSEKKIQLLYMELVEDIVGVAYDKDWKWASSKESGKKYGEFLITKKTDYGSRKIILPSKYFKKFYVCVEPTIQRKKDKFEDRIENSILDKSGSCLSSFSDE